MPTQGGFFGGTPGSSEGVVDKYIVSAEYNASTEELVLTRSDGVLIDADLSAINAAAGNHEITGFTYDENSQNLTINQAGGITRTIKITGFVLEGTLFSLSDLVDTAINSPIVNEVLTWNGSHWVNQTLPTIVDTERLEDLTDTSIVNPLADEILAYNGANWVNRAVADNNTTFSDTPNAGTTLGVNFTDTNNNITATVDASGIQGTTYTAGDGIDIVSEEISVDETVIATRAYVDSQTHNDTTYTAGTGLNLNAEQFSVDTGSIATRAYVDSQVHTDTTYAAGNGIGISGANNDISVNTSEIMATTSAPGVVAALPTVDAGKKVFYGDGTWDESGSVWKNSTKEYFPNAPLAIDRFTDIQPNETEFDLSSDGTTLTLGISDGAITGAKLNANLDDLADVNIPSPTNSQTIIWDDATSQWVAGSAGGNNYLATNITSTLPTATGTEALALGGENTSGGEMSMSVGFRANASGDNSISLGANLADTTTDAIGTNAVAIGNDAKALSNDNIVIGHNAMGGDEQDATTAVGGIVLGHNAISNNSDTVAIGGWADASGDNAIAIGNSTDEDNQTIVGSANGIALGYQVLVGAGSTSAIAIGQGARVRNDSVNSFAIGQGVDVNGANIGQIGNSTAEVRIGRQTAITDNDLQIATKKYVDDNSGGGGGGPTDNSRLLIGVVPGSLAQTAPDTQIDITLSIGNALTGETISGQSVSVVDPTGHNMFVSGSGNTWSFTGNGNTVGNYVITASATFTITGVSSVHSQKFYLPVNATNSMYYTDMTLTQPTTTSGMTNEGNYTSGASHTFTTDGTGRLSYIALPTRSAGYTFKSGALFFDSTDLGVISTNYTLYNIPDIDDSQVGKTLTLVITEK